MAEPVIRRYEEGDEEPILDLFRLAFGKPMTPAFWRWRFRENPAGPGEILLQWDGDVLAGHYAAIPTSVAVDGRNRRALLSMTTMVHPAYGGRGIFTTLADRLYTEAHSAGFDLVYGFPNSKSRHGFAAKLGWTDLGSVSALRGLTSTLPAKADLTTERGSSIPQDAERVMLVASETCLTRIPRTLEFMRWRYEMHPDQPYEFVSSRDAAGRLNGLAVVKVYRGGAEPVGHVIDIAALSKDALEGVLAGARSIFDESSAHIVESWLPAAGDAAGLLVARGHAWTDTETYFGYRSFSPTVSRSLSIDDWCLTMGDSDVF
jgi:GNAT superfamily N-acetyltransferase